MLLWRDRAVDGVGNGEAKGGGMQQVATGYNYIVENHSLCICGAESQTSVLLLLDFEKYWITKCIF